MSSLAKKAFDVLASFWLAIVVLAFLFLLTVIGTLERNRILFSWLDGGPSRQKAFELMVEVFAVNEGLQHLGEIAGRNLCGLGHGARRMR